VTDRPRLIEVAFPLKQASIDSVHEKNVRHGHISTLHIWPARRPLAACRAALIATLLPDPGDSEERRELLERIGGRVIERVERKKIGRKVTETRKEKTEGGVLHWGRESSPDMEWFRQEIRKAYGGRAPRVLDPFAGGGAIPLEAMRLGCEVTAIDINPVAWFILKCTLEYPQKLAGKKLPLPNFALKMPAFRKSWEEARTRGGKKKRSSQQPGTIDMFDSETPEADLAWHVRAWGHWVLERARKDLERYYPMVDHKPTVAYLWARTVRCKGCAATIPLLKTRWLCKKDAKLFCLTMKPKGDRSGVDFGIEKVSAGAARDKKAGAGTMTRSGAQCPCCPAIMTMEDIRLEGQAGRLGAVMTAVVVDGENGKEYRAPTAEDIAAAEKAASEADAGFAELPFGQLREPINTGSVRKGGVSITRWGIREWREVFNGRQLRALASLVRIIRSMGLELASFGYDDDWCDALLGLSAASLDRLANQCSTVSRWNNKGENIEGTFSRFALPLLWDFAEVNPLGDTTGGLDGAYTWVSLAVEHAIAAVAGAPRPRLLAESSTNMPEEPKIDAIVTDPPYYDAIPYADLTDFFYVWLRRVVYGSKGAMEKAFREPVTPKWDHSKADGELVDDESRFGGDHEKSKAAYEAGLFRVFQRSNQVLTESGRLVIVFANKQPDAWETLVSAIIRAGFVVDGSWPIQTERAARTRSLTSAALSSSVWLVCKKRPETARPGWDNRVLEEMSQRIYTRLRDFWDAGIRGPDFVWAATGPALEAYSKHPVVKRANEPGQILSVSEFLRHVRRIVVDFVVGRVLTGEGGTEAVSGLDDVTTYYLLHRHDFGVGEAPVGASILYAISCGLSDRDLSDRYDLLARTGAKAAVEEYEDDDDEAEEGDEEDDKGGGSGNKVKLKTWDARRGKNLGLDTEGRPAPIVDQVHRLMHLWRTGDVAKVNEYLDARALWKHQVFHQLLQALIELAPAGSEERSLLESISNHVGARSSSVPSRQENLQFDRN
jgi:putative DNA methylase